MKFSLTGTAANGTPVSRQIEMPDIAAAMAYAQNQGITVSRLEIAAERDPQLPAPAKPVPRYVPTEGEDLGWASRTLFTFAWICCVMILAMVAASMLTMEPFAALIVPFLVPLAAFLFLLGAIYSIGGAITRAIERNQK